MKSLNKAFWGIFLGISFLASIASCKPSVPGEYLSEKEMENVLYDFHIAEAMANDNSRQDGDAAMITYREAVFKKHGITAAEFDSSMVYYMRHTKLLHDIYVNLGDRLTAEAQAMGADVSDLNSLGNMVSSDTANIWKGPSAMVLSTYKPYNYYSFEVPVDTSFHKGDKLMLNFQAQFLFQEGMRDGVAMLAVTFKNDSVAYSNSRMSSSQSYSIQVEDRDSLGIKSVKGYFLLNVGDFGGAESYTTMKLMFVHHIKLVKLRMKPQPMGNQNVAGDSANARNGGPNAPGNPGSGSTPGSVSGSSAGSPSGSSVSPVSGRSLPPRPQLSSPGGSAVPPDRLRNIEVKR